MNTETYQTLLQRSDERILAYVNSTDFCKKEFIKKNKQYGETLLTYRPKSLLTRIWNKAVRVRSIQDKKQQRVSDSLVSEFDAMYNYSIVVLIVIEKMVSNQLAITIPVELEPQNESLETSYENMSEKCFDLFKTKDHDYNGAWVQMRVSGIIDEIMVKLQRSVQILKADIPFEDIKKKCCVELMDIANYAIFGSILIKVLEVNPME